MAMIDYGALLKVNGDFINKDKGLFIDMKETVGFVLNTATYPNHDTIKINNNYFVYAGSPDLLLCFYKTCFHIINNGQIIRSYWGDIFKSETLYIGDVHIKIEHLNNEWVVDKYEIDQKLKEFLSQHDWLKYIKRVNRLNKKSPSKYKTNRYVASWEHNKNKYEVIFGYGIESNEETWNNIKLEDGYDFTDKERQIIDRWFI